MDWKWMIERGGRVTFTAISAPHPHPYPTLLLTHRHIHWYWKLVLYQEFFFGVDRIRAISLIWQWRKHSLFAFLLQRSYFSSKKKRVTKSTSLKLQNEAHVKCIDACAISSYVLTMFPYVLCKTKWGVIFLVRAVWLGSRASNASLEESKDKHVANRFSVNNTVRWFSMLQKKLRTRTRQFNISFFHSVIYIFTVSNPTYNTYNNLFKGAFWSKS